MEKITMIKLYVTVKGMIKTIWMYRRGLSSGVPRDSYDVVVVGGGHNGLVSAAYLAKAGLKTAVLERRHVVGK